MILYFVQTIFLRSYRYLLLAFLSLAVGAFLFGSVVSLSTSLSSYFIQEGKTLIGADAVIEGARPIDVTQGVFAGLRERGHVIATQYGVQAVFRSASGSSSVAASVRAVDQTFPLYGTVTVDGGTPFAVGNRRMYAERAFLNKLGIGVGDSVLLGDGRFVIAGVLLREPDAVSAGVSLSPRVILASDDLLSSGIDVSQSRTSYKAFVRQGDDALLSEADFEALEAYAREEKLRFDDSRDGPNNLVRGLSSAGDFSGIVLAIALFLVAVNIGANLTYILARFRKTMALLKTFGATTAQIRLIYLIILGLLGGVAGLIGSFLGAWAVTASLPALSSYFSGTVSPAPLVPIALFGGLSGLFMSVVAAIPFLNSLSSITPKQLLASVSFGVTKGRARSVLPYLPLPIFLASVLYAISRDLSLTAYAIAGIVMLFSIFALVSHGMISLLYSLRGRFSFMFSSIISFLKLRGIETVVTSASIMTALSGVFIVTAIEENIVHNIEASVSQSAPALFIVDITASQLAKVREIAGPTFREYPIVRGRLLAVNDRDLTTSSNGGITREFNMTYRNDLIEGESVVSGIWHGSSGVPGSISFDRSFAEEVGGVELGDTVTVFVQGLTVRATVTSIHEADRSQGTPFFFMVFSPDVLGAFPTTYFGTVRETPEAERSIEDRLGALFPNIIPIQTGRILETVSALLGTVIRFVNVIGIPSVVLGLMLVLVMTGQSLYERRGDVLVLRAFGMGRREIVALFIAEAGTLILIATGISFAVAHLIAYALNEFLFSFDLFSFAIMPIYISAGILVVTGVFSYGMARSIVRAPLKRLLSEK
jgi:putative ABC transport system permease protein